MKRHTENPCPKHIYSPIGADGRCCMCEGEKLDKGTRPLHVNVFVQKAENTRREERQEPSVAELVAQL